MAPMGDKAIVKKRPSFGKAAGTFHSRLLASLRVVGRRSLENTELAPNLSR